MTIKTILFQFKFNFLKIKRFSGSYKITLWLTSNTFDTLACSIHLTHYLFSYNFHFTHSYTKGSKLPNLDSSFHHHYHIQNSMHINQYLTVACMRYRKLSLILDNWERRIARAIFILKDTGM